MALVYPGAMLTRTDLRTALPGRAGLREVMPRAEVNVDAVLEQVRPIVAAVAERGVDAVLEFAERFDRVRPESVRVPAEVASPPWTVTELRIWVRSWVIERLS